MFRELFIHCSKFAIFNMSRALSRYISFPRGYCSRDDNSPFMPQLLLKRFSLATSLDTLLKQCYSRPACRPRHPPKSRRQQSTHPIPQPDIPDVAVLGGGITGLSTAYYLSKSLPTSTRIVLFEADSRLGGWLNSTSVDVGNGKVVFEAGPRTLRPSVPNGLVTLDLVCAILVHLIYVVILCLFWTNKTPTSWDHE